VKRHPVESTLEKEAKRQRFTRRNAQDHHLSLAASASAPTHAPPARRACRKVPPRVEELTAREPRSRKRCATATSEYSAQRHATLSAQHAPI